MGRARVSAYVSIQGGDIHGLIDRAFKDLLELNRWRYSRTARDSASSDNAYRKVEAFAAFTTVVKESSRA